MTKNDALFDVSSRVFLLTGACGLIGRHLAGALHARGARLALVDVPAAHPGALAAELGEGTAGLPADVSDAASVNEAVEAAERQLGPVDVLLNAHQHKPAGFLTAAAESFPEELWDAIIDVNLKGTFLTCREVGRRMLKRGRGSIVNFGSTYGVVSSNPDLYAGNSLGNPLAYSASKGGVVMMTKYLGAYWASRGVRVNCVTPHGVWNRHEETFVERFAAKSPMKRLMMPDEIVGAVLFLSADASTYVTGSNLMVDGGWTAW